MTSDGVYERIFFFSSRRRHTRFKCDWSSDVCSSDLSDAIVNAIVAERIDQTDCAKGFILDGYPRTLVQADAVESMLSDRGLGLDAVIELVVDDKALVGRIVKRAEEARAAGQPVRKDDNPAV